ncbi:T4 family baseplate hub assembly chaperone, partial [Xanthomonas campestris]|uniref:T4 family baseplate hub assembly chaperone n=1 Tax=Xanthomonas campestris TaxID=339 RepID=UPI00403A359F
MANIVRCELPDGVQRFKPFTVEDYRDLLLVRYDMNTKSEEEQKQLIAELMDDYFHDHPAEYRPYIFLKVFLSS